ncbi:MAG: CDP-alcohol phosphatidyltransferase family protein [Oscillospiraceae bacterium]|nr:CDP-alcohol phosphatidyltransferase family protein [Oscillospiraceae bacterium]
MKLRYIPNVLSGLRIVLAIVLIFIPPLRPVSYIILYIACFTDLIDGPLARRIPNGKTKIGADLDSVGDLLLIVVGIFVLMPAMNIWDELWFAAIGILVLRSLSASISGLIKHGQVCFNHTWSSKAGSLALLVGLIIYSIIGGHLFINIFIVVAVIWQLLVAIEEAIINLLLKKPNTNIRGIWEVKKENASHT